MFPRIQFDGVGWSGVSIRASKILRCDPPDYCPVLTTTDGPARAWADPLAALDWLSRDQTESWYGFLSYDLGRWFEQLPTAAVDDRHLPLFAFAAGESIEPIAARHAPAAQTVATPTVSRRDYESQIARCLEYISAGDVFQINLSQRFSVATTDAPTNIYARLQAKTPATHAAFLDFGDFQLLSNSPELFLDLDQSGRLQTRPIKGTRALRDPVQASDGDLVMIDKNLTTSQHKTEPFDLGDQHLGTIASTDEARDVAQRRASPNRSDLHEVSVPTDVLTVRESSSIGAPADLLLDSVKDAAELNMIIDLERNDLGRVCEIGSVRVTQPRTIETHPTVVHGVATIQGQLRRESTFVDILRAMFPGGSVTGAPKIRAMQIIDELEPFCRGHYCGAIGVLRPDGSHTFNLAIRTIVIQNGRANVQVGGGIVADSAVAEEYEETLVKAAAMFQALGVNRVILERRD